MSIRQASPLVVAAGLLTIVALSLLAIQIRNGAIGVLPLLFDAPVATLAILFWIAAVHRSAVTSRAVTSALVGGVITGATGFVLGFIGPLIVTPQSNLGPLLGILITGPLGFLFGVVGGFAYGMVPLSRLAVWPFSGFRGSKRRNG